MKDSIVHTFSGSGKHRLECGRLVGELVAYSSIAFLNVDGKIFAATTEYWAGTLPSFFEIKPGVVEESYLSQGIPGKDEEELERALSLINTLGG